VGFRDLEDDGYDWTPVSTGVTAPFSSFRRKPESREGALSHVSATHYIGSVDFLAFLQMDHYIIIKFYLGGEGSDHESAGSYKDREEGFVFFSTFFKSVLDTSLELEWKLFKRV
jgi:hypothetical protein